MISDYFQIAKKGEYIMKENEYRYCNDEGKEFHLDLVPKSNLCILCRKDDDPSELVLCNLTRADQQDEDEFECFAFELRK